MSDTKNPDKSNSQANSFTFDNYMPFYTVYRENIKREQDLVNTRLMWLLTIHGFLYATYGFTLQKELEVSEKINSIYSMLVCPVPPVCYMLGRAEIFLMLISVVGILISAFGLVSISAAREASNNVYSIFAAKLEQYQFVFVPAENSFYEAEAVKAYDANPSNKKTKKRDILSVHLTSDGYYVPDVRGGGLAGVAKRGFLASEAIPKVLLSSWLISIILSVLVWIVNHDIICAPIINLTRFF